MIDRLFLDAVSFFSSFFYVLLLSIAVACGLLLCMPSAVAVRAIWPVGFAGWIVVLPRL
jgi:hypothetical protein